MRQRSLSMFDLDYHRPVARHPLNDQLHFWWINQPRHFGNANRLYETTRQYYGNRTGGSEWPWTADGPSGMRGAFFPGASNNVQFPWMWRGVVGRIATVGRNSNTTSRVSIQWHSDNTCYFIVDTGAAQAHESIAFNTTGWHYFELAYDGTQAAATDRIRGYIDGALQATTLTGTPPTTVPAAAQVWAMNFSNGGSSASATGAYGDLRVSARPFTAPLYYEAREGFPHLLNRRSRKSMLLGIENAGGAVWDASQWARFIEERPDRNQGRRAVAY
jgi:hypothetical protein